MSLSRNDKRQVECLQFVKLSPVFVFTSASGCAVACKKIPHSYPQYFGFDPTIWLIVNTRIVLFFVKFLRDKRTPASHRVRQPQVSLCLSRVCAVAQYAVLEANANVNGRGPFSHHHPSETPQPISMSCQIYYYIPPRSWCAKFGWNRFTRLYGFFFINISICLSVGFFVGATGHSFVAIFTLNGSNDVILQPLVPFGGQINIAPY